MLDTSYLMNRENILDKLLEEYLVVINIVVIEELDHLKQSENSRKAFQARRAIKSIERNKNHKHLIFDVSKAMLHARLNNTNEVMLDNINDNIIVSRAYDYKALLATDDLNLKIKAEIFQIKIFEYPDEISPEYTGYIEVTPTTEEWKNIFEDRSNNIYNCLCNQFVIMRDENGEIACLMKWTGKEYININYKTFKSEYMGDIQPKNVEQKLALDILQNNDITIKVLTGCQGTGKDYLMISNALQLVKNKKYDRIVWVRNNIEVKDSKPIGFLPDGVKDKLLPFAKIIADHIGGEQKLISMINLGKIEIEHLGFIRGRDIKNAIILCSEAENMTREQIALLIGRVGENSALWINGDYEQVDDKTFEQNNGLLSMINRLKGQEVFGYVKLKEVERSQTSKLAKLLN